MLYLSALGFGVEMTDCLNFSIEEIDPDRFIGAGREDIDNTAAHSIFPASRTVSAR